MATLLEELLVRLGADVTGFEKGISDALKTAKRMQNDFKEVGKSLTEFVTVPLVGLAVAAVHAAAEEQAAMARVKSSLENVGVSWNKASGTVASMLNQLEEMTGFNNTDLADSFNRMTNVTQNARLSMQALGVAANISRAGFGGLGEVSAALARGLSGSTTALKRMGINMREGATSTQILTELTKRFGSTSAEYMNTTAGHWAALKNKWDEALKSLGNGLLPVANTFANVMMKMAGYVQAVGTWFGKLSPEGKTLTLAIAGLAAAAGPVLFAVSKIIGIAPTLIKYFTIIKNLNWLMIAGFAAIAFFALEIYVNWDKVGAYLKSIFYGLLTALNMLVAGFFKFVSFITSWVPGLGAVTKKIAGFMDGIAESTATNFSNAAADMGANGDFMGNTLDFLKDKLGALSKMLGLNGESFAGHAKTVKGNLDDLNGAAQDDTLFFKEWADAMKANLDTLGQQWDYFTGNTMGAFGAWGRAMTKTAAEVATNIKGSIAKGVSDITVGLAQGTLEWDKLLMGFLVSSLESMITWAITSMTVFQTLSEAIATALTNPFVAIVAIGLMIGAVAALAGGFKGRALASGGVTTGPTTALVGDNPSGEELVLPLDNPRAMSRVAEATGGGGRGQQTIYVQIDGRTVAQSTVEHFPAVLRLQGIG